MAAIETRPNGHQSPDVRPDFERARDILNLWLTRDGYLDAHDIEVFRDALDRILFRLETDFDSISGGGHRAAWDTPETSLKRTTGGHESTAYRGRCEW